MKQQSLPHFYFLNLFLICFFAFTPLHGRADDLAVTLTARQQCDLELLMNGGFAPLHNFMDRENYESVLHHMRLVDGSLWPIPIVLDVSDKIAQKIEQIGLLGCRLLLRDSEGFLLAKLSLESMWKPNKEEEAALVYATTDRSHPGVHYLWQETGNYYVCGAIEWVQKPTHFDFKEFRLSPQEIRASFQEKGIDRIIGFHSRSLLSPAYLQLINQAVEQQLAGLLFHPVVGAEEGGEFDEMTRVKCYKSVLHRLPQERFTFSLLPMAMRWAGPREALWQAIVRKNYGCTHFIVASSEAGPSTGSKKEPWYDPKALFDFVNSYGDELGMAFLSAEEIEHQTLAVEERDFSLSFTESELKSCLRRNEEVSSAVAFPEVVDELKKTYPPSSQRGFTLFFTGLSGAGKSTIAKALALQLMELQDRPVTILDGDVIRTHLSSELGFSKEHRSLNVKRVGFVAGEITKNRGIAICAMIAPYASDRHYNRRWIENVGDFIEIYVATPFDVCAERDTKGFYQQVKEGKMTGFTGFDDPYQIPERPEILIDTTKVDVTAAVDLILHYLRSMKYIL